MKRTSASADRTPALNGRGGAGMTLAAFKSNADKKYGDMSAEYLKLYPAAIG